MRLDLFLKVTRLLKQRTVAKQACDDGAVTLNGAAAKPGTLVRAGDRLELHLPSLEVAAEVLEVPARANVRKQDVGRYVRILERDVRDPHTWVFGDEADSG